VRGAIVMLRELKPAALLVLVMSILTGLAIRS
jgi:hypothetical protein